LLCDAKILIPGEDGYLCSSRICGAKIVIKDSKTKKVSRTHPPKGWVKYADVPELLKKAKAERERQERRAKM
jgi:hypothetical protein